MKARREGKPVEADYFTANTWKPYYSHTHTLTHSLTHTHTHTSPGMPEMLSPSAALVGAGLGKDVALVTDGRFSGASHGTRNTYNKTVM